MKLQSNNIFWFKFCYEEDKEKVLEWGSQHIANRLFVIRVSFPLYTVPFDVDDGEVAFIEAEYAWKPPKCLDCCLFDHITYKCEARLCARIQVKVMALVPIETILGNNKDQHHSQSKESGTIDHGRSLRPIADLNSRDIPENNHGLVTENANVSSNTVSMQDNSGQNGIGTKLKNSESAKEFALKRLRLSRKHG
ncbi:hypothetical protein GIB67_024186 [Kingdonia uniflora]|uniref:Uncharacterized protein n=1 Tax=Kingdonia uniflora TaxID=39325 RepID=A0A7J7LZE3_9MAGN|nr:hypothetical protein GIB67_024186 [Kingdonia uniflora]